MYFDITEISREAEFDSTLLSYDKLHPSNKMYNLWVQEMKDEILDSLQSNN